MTENLEDFIKQLEIADIKRDGSDTERAELLDDDGLDFREDEDDVNEEPSSTKIAPRKKKRKKHKKHARVRTEETEKSLAPREGELPFMVAPPKGTPAYEEYKELSKKGLIRHKGRRFSTDEELALAAEVRKKRQREWQKGYEKAKYRRRRKRDIEQGLVKVRPKKYVRKKKAGFLTYQEAQEVVQYELIRSYDYYRMWYEDNKPANMPHHPDRFYKDDWVDWPTFLGRPSNKFPKYDEGEQPVVWRSYSDSHAFVSALKNIKTQKDWTALIRSGTVPPDIPVRPDMIYRRTGEWTSWSQFLRKPDMLNVGKTIPGVEYKYFFYVLKLKNVGTDPLFKIGVTKGGMASVKDALVKYKNLAFHGAWEVPATFDFKMYASYYGEEDWETKGLWRLPEYDQMCIRLDYIYRSTMLGEA
jgi:hypothetical protein